MGTSGNDNFTGYYSSTSWLPSDKLVNFMAGAGDDLVGGSSRAGNIWGGTGNDTLLGYEGADKLYIATPPILISYQKNANLQQT